MQATYRVVPFAELTVHELYAILRLRAEVFVVEQTCYYQDLDDKDQRALHLLASVDGKLAGYTRLLDKGISYPDYASIGRVVTAPFARGKGLGRPLMQESIKTIFAHYGHQPLKISAQAHLQAYYNSVGFEGVGAIYDEDGIPHRAMVYQND